MKDRRSLFAPVRTPPGGDTLYTTDSNVRTESPRADASQSLRVHAGYTRVHSWTDAYIGLLINTYMHIHMCMYVCRCGCTCLIRRGSTGRLISRLAGWRRKKMRRQRERREGLLRGDVCSRCSALRQLRGKIHEEE